jgi:ABC-type sulfate transport system permease subunit
MSNTDSPSIKTYILLLSIDIPKSVDPICVNIYFIYVFLIYKTIFNQTLYSHYIDSVMKWNPR